MEQCRGREEINERCKSNWWDRMSPVRHLDGGVKDVCLPAQRVIMQECHEKSQSLRQRACSRSWAPDLQRPARPSIDGIVSLTIFAPIFSSRVVSSGILALCSAPTLMCEGMQ